MTTTNDKKEVYINSLIEFLNNSSCSYTAVDTISKRLDKAGYTRLYQNQKWSVRSGDKFYLIQNDSAIFAFNIGSQPIGDSGFKIVAAHSDSPTFKIKPSPVINSEGGVIRLNTEAYGGAILYSWFDRPLSISGRVIVKGEDAMNPIVHTLRIERPIMIIPQLPIHFNRTVNDGYKISKQKDMLPICGIVNDAAERDDMLIKLIANELNIDMADIIDFDLSLYCTEKATTLGINNEFIASGRLDDLSMVEAATTAFIQSTNNQSTQVLAIFDNEEVGSHTRQGAGSPVLTNALKRIVVQLTNGDEQEYYRAVANSFMLSADNAHAYHPSHNEKFDPTNHPTMGAGITIKINANSKYMTDALSSSKFSELCRGANIPIQYFVNHSDVAGGSTLGNIFTSQMDVAGVDIGNPIWSMHSAIETGSVDDHINMIQAMKTFYEY